MAYLTTYSDFLARVDELGFFFLSSSMPGLTSVGAETAESSWHTGDGMTDPWQWKDRAAQEKQAAYGCVLGGHKGFISARLYPFFYAICHPRLSMEERYAAGEVNQTTWQVWQLFDRKTLLSTSEIRKEMGVQAKSGVGRLDASIQDLQQHFYIAIAGNRRKVGKDGQPYGWPNSVYDRALNWAPPEWTAEVGKITLRVARAVILDAGSTQAPRVPAQELARILKLGE